MATYTNFLEWLLGISFLKTYFKTPEDCLKSTFDKKFKLTEQEINQVLDNSVEYVVGAKKAKQVANRTIKKQAIKASIVTFLCSIPQNFYIMLPCLLIDIIYFQRQEFIVAQQLEIIYGQKNKNKKFIFSTVSKTVFNLMEGVVKDKLTRYLKSAFGKAIRTGIEHSFSIFKSTIRTFFKQILKWLGIGFTKSFLDVSLETILYLSTALVAALISYWLFIPMAKKLQRQIKPTFPVPNDANQQQLADS